ncbi:hypothetical protein RZS08_09070, partial [Arthrospira platensis SPKY1]|nr:hypothetical protein [Arthrospira platensis SPKY1]
IFAMAHQVIGIPIHSDALEHQLKDELRRIFNSMEQARKIEVFCSPHDEEYVHSLTQGLSLKHVIIQTKADILPGEYQVFTHNQKVVRQFKKSLLELQDKLTIEQWGRDQLHSTT